MKSPKYKFITIFAFVIITVIGGVLFFRDSTPSYEKARVGLGNAVASESERIKNYFNENMSVIDSLVEITQKEEVYTFHIIRVPTKEGISAQYMIENSVSPEEFRLRSEKLYEYGETVVKTEAFPFYAVAKTGNEITFICESFSDMRYPSWTLHMKITNSVPVSYDYCEELSNGWFLVWRLYPLT